MHRLVEEAGELEDLRMLFGPYVPENCLVHFPSPRDVGKSWFCMQLCLAISSGWGAFLGEPITLHGNTLYISTELGKEVIQRRLKKLFVQPPLPISDSFRPMVYASRTNLIDDLPKIATIIEKLKPVLIVIDNLRLAFAGADTNNNKEITKLMFTLLAICESSKATVIITDHFRKHTSGQLSDSDLQAGSGIKSDLADADFFLRKSAQDKHYRILKRGKSRHFEEADNAKLIRFNPATYWFELISDDVNEAEHVGIRSLTEKSEQKDMAQALRSQGKTLDQIAVILGKGKATIHRWLKGDGVDPE